MRPYVFQHLTHLAAVPMLLALAASIQASDAVARPGGGFLASGPPSTTTKHDQGLIAYTSAGAVDMSVDGDGRLTTGITTPTEGAQVYVNGSFIYVSGEAYDAVAQRPVWVIRRYVAATMALDPAWGGAGIVQFANASGMSSKGFGLSFTTDGKILASGTVINDAANLPYPLYYPRILRLRSDGSLDTSFGQDGQYLGTTNHSVNFIMRDVAATTDGGVWYLANRFDGIGATANRLTPAGIDVPGFGFGSYMFGGLEISADGGCLIAGMEPRSFITGTLEPTKLFIRKLTPAVTLDPTFANTVVIPSIDTVIHFPTGVTATGGAIYAWGYRNNYTSTFGVQDRQGFVYKVSASGVPDASFGNGGLAILDTGATSDRITAVIGSGGSTWVFGQSGPLDGNQQHLIGRLTAAGAWDTSFNTVGYRLTQGGGGNTPPVVTSVVAVGAVVNAPFSWALGPKVFSDPDGDTLTYSASGLPNGITFAAATRTLAGTPTAIGTSTVTITANDGNGGSVSTAVAFTVSAAAAPSAPVSPPVVANPSTRSPTISGTALAGQTVHIYVDGFEIPGTATVGAGGAWTFVSTGDQRLSQGAHSIAFRVSNGAGGAQSAASPSVAIVVDTIPPATPTYPNVSGNTASGTTEPGATVHILLGTNGPAKEVATVVADAAGRWRWVPPVTITVRPSFISVFVTDTAGNSSGVSYAWDSPTGSSSGVPNQAPVVLAGIANQYAQVNVPFSFTIPSNAFSDPEGQRLYYEGIDETRTFSIKPTEVGSTSYTVWADDHFGGRTGTSFTLTVGTAPAGNRPPAVAQVIPDQTTSAGVPWSFAFNPQTFTDINGDRLTYGATGMPAGISFTPATRSFAGIAQGGTSTITVTAIDGNGGLAITSFILNVTGNRAPTVQAGVDQSVALAASATLSGLVNDDGLPAPAALTYAWTKVSGPGTVTFSAPAAVDTTAGFSAAGSYVLQLSASDGALTATDTLTVTVIASGPVPGDLNNSGSVTAADLTLFLTSYGKSVGEAGYLAGANLNVSGSSASTVDFDDLAAFLALYNN